MSECPEHTDTDAYAVGVSEQLESPWGEGLMTAATGGDRSANPHPTDGLAWQDWLRGFEAWETAPKITLDVPDDIFS